MGLNIMGAVLRRHAALAVAAGVLVTGLLPAGAAGAAQTAPTSLITSPGYKRTTEEVGPGLTLLTYENPNDDRIVHVLRADPDIAPLTVESTTGVAGALLEKTTDMLKSTTSTRSRWPHAGINGGFFYETTDGQAFMGISVQEGQVQSASCVRPRREAVLIQHGRPYISDFTTYLTVSVPGVDPVPLDGVNRHPGWMRGCAQNSGAKDYPLDENYRTNPSEIVAFTPQYKAPTPRPDGDSRFTEDDDPGAEAVMDARGRVLSLNPNGRGGTTVPAGGRVLQGTGSGAAWLRAHATVGSVLSLQERVRDERFGDDIPLDDSVDIVNGSYPLVRDAKYAYTGNNNSVDPRSAIAVDGPGRTLFVTVTGKKARSGAKLDELSRILLDLGAVDGLNLDGGGSTTLVVKETIRNRPADTAGERAVADSVYIGHGGYGLYAN
jgi:hypothetical protein